VAQQKRSEKKARREQQRTERQALAALRWSFDRSVPTEDVAALQLDLAGLLERLVLPEADRPLFIQLMQERLDLPSMMAPLAPALQRAREDRRISSS
jgi:hypothetical protein